MYMNRPFILLVDIFNACIPTQNIQIVDEITDTVIVEGKESELLDLLNEYGDCEVYIMRVHRETLTIVIKP